MKKLRINNKNKFLFIKEVLVLQKLDHVNVLKIYEYFKTEQHYYILYYFFDGINLTDYFIKEDVKLTHGDIKRLIKDILSTVLYLHNSNILLRNLDPSNILYDGTNIKITGFKNAFPFNPKIYKKKEKYKFKECFTNFLFMAPEAFEACYGPEADVWTIGVMLHLYISGKLPFEATNKDELKEEILKTELDIEELKKHSIEQDAIDLISKMLKKDPNQRATIPDILKHPWLVQKEEDFNSELNQEIFSQFKKINKKSSLMEKLRVFATDKLFLDKEMNGLQKMFKIADINNDGVVTKKELKQSLEKLNLTISDTQINTIFKKFDQNNNGSLEFYEFAAAFIDYKKINESNKLEELYDFINVYKKERISLDDFEKRIYYKLNKKEKKLFTKFSDNNKTINKKNFIIFIQRFIHVHQEEG